MPIERVQSGKLLSSSAQEESLANCEMCGYRAIAYLGAGHHDAAGSFFPFEVENFRAIKNAEMCGVAELCDKSPQSLTAKFSQFAGTHENLV